MFSVTYLSSGTVRRFLENHGESIEAVVFAVSDTEEVCPVSHQLVQKITRLALAMCIRYVRTLNGLIFILLCLHDELFINKKIKLTDLIISKFSCASNRFDHL